MINGYANLIYEQVSGMGIITINRPQALNALNRATLTELDKLLEQISGDPATSVVIITGSGEKAFVAGADITEMKDLPALPGREVARLGQAVFNKLENLPQPVIAAVNGFALGGGCELALACDIRIAADNAKFGQPEVSLGIPPGFGGTQRLPRLIGKGRAQELLLTGDIIDAQEAYRLGLVNKIVPAGELQAAAKAMAEKIMGRAQIAVELCKSAVNKGLDAPLSVGLAYEAEVFGLCFATDDQKEGMAAFTERRKANFAGK
jgi:enoyl-CoA hydratase